MFHWHNIALYRIPECTFQLENRTIYLHAVWRYIPLRIYLRLSTCSLMARSTQKIYSFIYTQSEVLFSWEDIYPYLHCISGYVPMKKYHPLCKLKVGSAKKYLPLTTCSLKVWPTEKEAVCYVPARKYLITKSKGLFHRDNI